MPRSKWTCRESISRLLAGSAIGCVLLLAAELIFVVPVWGPRLLAGDERRERAFFVAQYGLPASVGAGALMGLAWRRSCACRLSCPGLLGCCLAIAAISQSLRPMVARRRGGVTPLFEVVPDRLAASACLAAVAIAVGYFAARLARRGA